MRNKDNTFFPEIAVNTIKIDEEIKIKPIIKPVVEDRVDVKVNFYHKNRHKLNIWNS